MRRGLKQLRNLSACLGLCGLSVTLLMGTLIGGSASAQIAPSPEAVDIQNKSSRLSAPVRRSVEILPEPPPLPAGVFVTTDGEMLELATLGERTLMLHVWASWCAPCVLEVPKVAGLSDDYADQVLEVVAVSLDRNADALNRFVDRGRMGGLTPWWDVSGTLLSELDAEGLPLSVFYGPGGQELFRVNGDVDWHKDEARALVDAALAAAQPVAE